MTLPFATYSDPASPSTTDIKTVASKAYVDTKQNTIPATTNTYTYDETNRPTADGSVVTTGATDGTVGERGIATAPVSDGNGGYSNNDWLPTVGAMMNAINAHTPTGTPGNVAMYDATTGALGDGRPTADAASYNETTGVLENGTNIATIAAVETKVSKIQSTGYQVLTTGTTGTVTTDYISVPVTTSGSGRPTNNNTPTSMAAIWIE